MAITTSRAALVIDTIVTKLKASATFADPVRVFDGPNTVGDTMWTQAVFVGFDGNWHETPRGQVAPGVEYEAVLINQQLEYIGGPVVGTSVKETLEVRCSAECWSGDPTCQTARNQTVALLAGVETVIRTDPTLGIDGGTIASVQVGSLVYEFDPDGNIGCRAPFVVHVLTTILSS